MWYYVLCLEFVSIPTLVYGGIAKELAEATQLCCDQGTKYARDHTSKGCTSSVPPDISPAYGTLCILAMDQCCKEYFQKKANCEDGAVIANKGNCDSTSGLTETCCTECTRGKAEGSRLGETACTPSVRGTSLEELLAGDAYESCCKVVKNRCKPHNPCQHKCNDNGIQVKCSCRRGYELLSDGKSCKDIDECILDPPVCLPSTQCHNIQGSYRCISTKKNKSLEVGQCPPGFTKNIMNNACDDIDECVEGTHLCDLYQDCLNTNGSHECNCKIGFEQDMTTGACADVNECATDQHSCFPETQRCDNTIGSFRCTRVISCGTGYILQHATGNCEEIDECALGTHNCARAGPNYHCVNVPGSFRCVRKRTTTTSTTPLPKYEYHYDSEEEIVGNETIPQTGNQLESTHSSSTTPKPETSSETSRTNEIPSTPNTLDKTEDERINEVVPPSTELSSKSTNNFTSKISRPVIQSETQKKDAPKNEWTKVNEKPTNCQFGFEMDENGACYDIDECVTNRHKCSGLTEICKNAMGGYLCECAPGFSRDFHTGACDLVVSSTSTSTSTTVPPPTTSRTVIRCPWGYRLGDDSTCVDIDECSTGEANCGPLQICMNLPGGYTCSCPSGHRLIGDHECEDVDECTLAGRIPICSQNADCINTIGSYQCRCHEGFRSAPNNDTVCLDVDECEENDAGSLCEQRCNNVWGSYRCSCHRGYRLNADDRTCADIDECTEFKSKIPCVGKCHNQPGSYRCDCPSGYRLSEDKRNCIDIDECKTGIAPCAGGWNDSGSSDVCINTRGGYRCYRIKCLPGYKLESKNRCTKVVRVCSRADLECIHQPVTYAYSFITFVSNLSIPDFKVDLFTIKGPTLANTQIKFELRLVDVNAPTTVKNKADINSFLLSQTDNKALVFLVRSLEGPQSIELELMMELHKQGQFVGIAVAKLIIFISEYEF